MALRKRTAADRDGEHDPSQLVLFGIPRWHGLSYQKLTVFATFFCQR